MEITPRRLLDLVIPFRFLPPEEKDALIEVLVLHQVPAFEMIFSEGSDSSEIYLIEDGQVELIYDEAPFVKPGNVVRPGHYFGERAALLSQKRSHGARAVTAVVCWSLDASRLLELIGRYNLFAQAFGTILRDKHGIFLPLEHFSAEVVQSLARGSFRLDNLVALYKSLEPALHPLAGNPDLFDLEALSYAVRRLPVNVTSTLAWYFTDDIPALYPEPSRLFPEIASTARRRNVWQMLPGKNMVLIRNGLSDILDFLTCLCLFAIESHKIRKRLHEPEFLLKLKECRDLGTESLADFPFSEEEVRVFTSFWGREVTKRLYELTVHHEDWTLTVERQLNNYNSRRSEKWANQVSRSVKQLMGLDPWDFPQDLEVHIISSNTHSVTNCLSPFPREKEAEVLAWARSVNHGFLALAWENAQDLVYGLLSDYFRADKTRPPTLEQEAEWGILRLEDQGTTGISVQLIDTSRLGTKLDPELKEASNRRRLIVNIDYAFGQQAEEIIRNLITLFHGHIRSVSILGKAGSLVGKRGDILVPGAFIQQSDDSFHPLPQPENLKRLSGRLKAQQVHFGPLLTVEGTLLQNRALLHFYRNIWRSIGLEMEGVFYARQVTESIQLGVLSPDVVQRYFYYVSDLPLQAGSQLSQPLSPAEGIPPLYAITREILIEVLK